MKSFMVKDLLQPQEELDRKENITSFQTFHKPKTEINNIDSLYSTEIYFRNKATNERMQKYFNDITKVFSTTNLLLFRQHIEFAISKMLWSSTYTEFYSYLFNLNKFIHSCNKTSVIDKTGQETFKISKAKQSHKSSVSRKTNSFEQNNANFKVPVFPCIDSYYNNTVCQPINPSRKCRRSRTVFTEVQVCRIFFNLSLIEFAKCKSFLNTVFFFILLSRH